MQEKKWYLQKTFWTAILTAGVTIGASYGFNYSVEQLMPIITVGLSLTAVFMRQGIKKK